MTQSQYKAEPMSRADLRGYAMSIRRELKLDHELNFPILEFLEAFPYVIDDQNFYYEIVPDSKLPKDEHAQYKVNENCICIKEKVYDGAFKNYGRDRMTIAHELSHVLLIKHSGIKLSRSFGGSIPSYQDPEWQAKCLAGELMIPADLIKNMPANKVAVECGVSVQAASYQLSKIKR